MLFLDVFRDYEADYSATLSAEEVETQAEEGGNNQREAENEEEEEGRGKLFLLLGMPPLFHLIFSRYILLSLFSICFSSNFFLVCRSFFPSFSFTLSLSHCMSMQLKYGNLLSFLRKPSRKAILVT